jgi:release factor glutamine methyltransferase
LTLREKLADARERLIRAGISAAEAAVDVDLYARTILHWDRARLLTDQSGPIPESLEPSFSEWIARRQQREPSAYIVGVREFWGLEFRVTPAVLIPRPETEFVVEESLALLRDAGRGRASLEEAPAGPPAASNGSVRIADVGTGSGCIGIALAHELPDCTVVATDVSADALTIAKENAARHRVADRVTFVRTSYLDGVEGPFDLIAANPPYVRERDKPALARDVRHEPDVALFGGTTGLRDIDAVMDTAVAKVRRGGWFVMEFGFGQEDDVRTLVGKRPELRLDRVRADLQGLARTAIVQRI